MKENLKISATDLQHECTNTRSHDDFKVIINKLDDFISTTGNLQ